MIPRKIYIIRFGLVSKTYFNANMPVPNDQCHMPNSLPIAEVKILDAWMMQVLPQCLRSARFTSAMSTVSIGIIVSGNFIMSNSARLTKTFSTLS